MNDAITGIDGSFSLVDHNGHPVTERDFRGRYMLVYFGFTHCRMVCPRSLTRSSEAPAALDPQLAQKIQPLYVSVDPERDSPEVMKAYLETSYPRFLGLTGDPDALEAAEKNFHVFTGQAKDRGDGYDVPHRAFVYVLGVDVRYLMHFPDAITGASDEHETRGASRSGSWCLAKKLGVGPSCKAFLFGSIDEPALRAALHGAEADELHDAGMIVVVTPDAASLEAAILDHERCAIDIPIWIVHGKGPRARFGEAAVREAMRNRGYSDTKVSAVSDTQSATRYAQKGCDLGASRFGVARV